MARLVSERIEAPALRPEHLVSRRTLARKSKDELIQIALQLMEDVRSEAVSRQNSDTRYLEVQQTLRATQAAAQKHINDLERTVQHRDAQVYALTSTLVAKAGTFPARDNIAPGVPVFARKGLVDP